MLHHLKDLWIFTKILPIKMWIGLFISTSVTLRRSIDSASSSLHLSVWGFPWKFILTALAGVTFFFLELYQQNWLASLLYARITIHFDDAYKSKMCLVGRLHCCEGVCFEGTTSSHTHTYTNKLTFSANKTCLPHLTFANFRVTKVENTFVWKLLLKRIYTNI